METDHDVENKSANWDWEGLSMASTASDVKTSTGSNQISSGNDILQKNKKLKDDADAYEQYSGLYLKERKISVEDINSNMMGRTMLKLSKLSFNQKVINDKNSNWVTIGVLAQKTPPRESSKGNKYVIWTLSDLNTTTINLFLFGEACEDHWMEMEGCVVALISPGILPANEKYSFSLKITQTCELAKIGTARDFGLCKGQTKGQKRCRIAINISKFQYCPIHLQSEFSKAGINRSAINAPGGLRKKMFNDKSMPKNISTGSYGRQLTGFNKRNPKQNGIYIGVNARITTTGETIINELKNNQLQIQQNLRHQQSVLNKTKLNRGEKIIAQILQPKNQQQFQPKSHSMQSILLLSLKDAKAKTNESKRDVLGDVLKEAKVKLNNPQMNGSVVIPKESSLFSKALRATSNQIQQKTLKRSTDNWEDTTLKDALYTQAKQKQIAQKLTKRGVDYEDNTSKKKIRVEKNLMRSSTSNELQTIKSIASKSIGNKNPKEQETVIERNMFLKAFHGHGINLKSKRGQDILSCRSQFADEADQMELEKLDKRFSSLEKSEYVATQLQQVKHMEVSAYQCKTCQYLLERPAASCSEMGHDVKRIIAVKRWFICIKCQYRQSVLNARLPTNTCKKCGNMAWERSSMYKERKVTDSKPAFKPTGDKEIQSLRYG